MTTTYMETSNNLIIVDSSGLISLIVESDSNHGKALAFANQFVGSQGRALGEDQCAAVLAGGSELLLTLVGVLVNVGLQRKS